MSSTNLFYTIVDGDKYLSLLVLDGEGILLYASLGTSQASLVQLMMKDFRSIKGYRLNSFSSASSKILSDKSRSLLVKNIELFKGLMSDSPSSKSKIKYKFIFGTQLQRKVWTHLVDNVPFGEVTNYSTVAKDLNKSASSSRAIGNCIGSNKLAIIVPCHRVLGSKGTLNGYRYGVSVKRMLLRAELGDNFGKYVKS
ncbi:methylated-DNA--protein-cysteine methyltransferase [Scheffersomyces amazonensis]|uniref:methylated-DNA--protein-cysteine methyltransferase n=1 Tax=Scheffersomyces amazonensis TaxID=1078765 RepID=UPI00315CE3B6